MTLGRQLLVSPPLLYIFGGLTLNNFSKYSNGENLDNRKDRSYKPEGVNMIRHKKHIFSLYAARWYEKMAKPNVSEVTAITYKRQLDYHIMSIIGDICIEDIKPLDIQEIFNQMGEFIAQETKNKVKNVLNQIFRLAIDEGLIVKNPMDSRILKIRGIASTTTIPYSVSDMKYFAAHLGEIFDPMERAWIALSISLPLRPEEVLGLRWDDVDGNIIHVRSTITHPTRNQPVYHEYTKTESSKRDLILPNSILKHLPERGRPYDFVIGGCNPISYTLLRGMRKRIAKQIGYDGEITPRRFRTTVATDISEQTHDLKLVQMMLGHSTPQMTLKHYVKGRSTAIDATKAIANCYGF